ncbi:hypothetical protein [Streptomyces sp. V4I2]|uniref:hypothetical protein n=1 Tax=Streptomyces sp. V4I2 TaxID=3042280 RepID=UPI0027877B2A|nr:hypothetical protein [Streptomyces sp. V4I2]MDQ1042976.1 hypothetical protein [Streptomyces sp. V4I2]
MDLRPELLPGTVPEARVRALGREIERIEELLRSGERVRAQAAIAAFNADTGHECGPYDFLAHSGSRSTHDFAVEAGRPVCPRVLDITRDALVEIVRRVLESESEPESDYFLRLFATNVAHPAAADLILRPPADLEGASAQRIVDAALAYRPLAL